VGTLLQHIIEGVTVGSTYGLVALGFSLQFAAMRLVNFAHGESFMLGAFTALVLSYGGYMPYAVALVGAVLLMGTAGVVIERVGIRPFYRSTELNMFIATIGLSLILRQAGLLIFGADAHPFPAGFGTAAIALGPATITAQQLGTLVCTIILMTGLELILHRTRMGLAMRAVAQDERTATLMGINTLQVKTMVYALSTALGAAAGILFASLTFAVFDMGLLMGVKGFTAAVLGGLGSLPGAVVGGLLLGLIEQFASGYISSLYRDTISLSVLVLILLVLPSGLLGRRGSGWGKV
jgi:branched-chain amino acid transport system permease protein